MVYRCRAEKVVEKDGMQHFEYVLEFVSEGSQRLIGMAPSVLLVQNQNVIERMTHPDDLVRMRQEIYDRVIAHEPYQVMYRLLLPGNVTKWVWDQGEGVYGPDDGLWYLEGLIMDVSERSSWN